MKGLFFTGTDTGVGKTVVTAAVARCLRAKNLRVGVCKPVATGAELQAGRWVSEDTLCLARAAGVEHLLERVTPWVFPDPAAPPVAAARKGVTLSIEAMAAAVRWWEAHVDIVLVEGVGGLLCPLTAQETVADLAALLSLPLIVVARKGLGTLNHTLLTLEVAAHRKLPVAGVILNEPTPPDDTLAEQTNIEELRRRIDVPILASMSYVSLQDENFIGKLQTIDWTRLTDLPFSRFSQ